MTTLRITEIFYSLQGESTFVGLPTVFIRLTGCPLRCQYCDTTYAFKGGQLMEVSPILSKVKTYSARHVTVTGGEPLAQQGCIELLTRFCDEGYVVSLETSGAMDVADVDPRVIKVMDIKTPGSGEEKRNDYQNIAYLLKHDQVKFVICHREDYDWVKIIIQQYHLAERCEILFSPSYEQQSARALAEWILQDGLRVRFQIQLHKYLWGNEPGR